jgi:hypothetical protein
MIRNYIWVLLAFSGAAAAQDAGDLGHYRDVARCQVSSAGLSWSRRWVPVRRCGDVSNCEHAFYALLVGGVTSLDRDRDGVPCESACSAVDDDAAIRVSDRCRTSYP